MLPSIEQVYQQLQQEQNNIELLKKKRIRKQFLHATTTTTTNESKKSQHLLTTKIQMEQIAKENKQYIMDEIEQDVQRKSNYYDLSLLKQEQEDPVLYTKHSFKNTSTVSLQQQLSHSFLLKKMPKRVLPLEEDYHNVYHRLHSNWQPLPDKIFDNISLERGLELSDSMEYWEEYQKKFKHYSFDSKKQNKSLFLLPHEEEEEEEIELHTTLYLQQEETEEPLLMQKQKQQQQYKEWMNQLEFKNRETQTVLDRIASEDPFKIMNLYNQWNLFTFHYYLSYCNNNNNNSLEEEEVAQFHQSLFSIKNYQKCKLITHCNIKVIIFHILPYLDVYTISNRVSLTCVVFQKLCEDSNLWQLLYARKFGHAYVSIHRRRVNWKTQYKNTLYTKNSWKKGKYVCTALEKCTEMHINSFKCFRHLGVYSSNTNQQGTIKVFSMQNGDDLCSIDTKCKNVSWLEILPWTMFPHQFSNANCNREVYRNFYYAIVDGEVTNMERGIMKKDSNNRDTCIISGGTCVQSGDSLIQVWNVSQDSTVCVQEYNHSHNPLVTVCLPVKYNGLYWRGLHQALPVMDMTEENNNNSLLMSADTSGCIKLWNLLNGQLVYSLQEKVLQCALFDQRRIVVGHKQIVRVLDLETKKPLISYAFHKDKVNSLHLDNQMILSASKDKTIKLYDLRSPYCIKSIGSEKSKEPTHLLADKYKLLSANVDVISVFEMRKMRLMETLTEGTGYPITSLQMDDSKVVANHKNYSYPIRMYHFYD